MVNYLEWVEKELNDLKSKSLFINFKIIDSPIDAKIKIEGKWYLNFSSNNYLGLANHINLKEGAQKALSKYGVGPAAVRTIAGSSKIHIELEKALAKFKNAEDVITYQSGFIANLSVVPVLVGENDLIFSDELNHASIIDACRLSKAEVIRFKHTDTDDLEEKLNSRLPSNNHKLLIITDGVFSMDGDIAPLPEIVKVAKKHKAMVMVDDAHGEGVLGRSGRGIVDHFKLHGQVDVEVGTLSKAFGVVGGLAAGKKEIIELLRQKSRPFLFSSAMTFPDVGAAIEAVKLLQKSDSLVKKLWENSEYFKTMLKNAGFDIGISQTPITPIMLGNEKLAKDFAAGLFENGIFAKPITYPTVALGKARVRLMLSANHDKKDLDNAIEIFKYVGQKMKLI